MANNPVQIVLNSDDFLRAPDPGQMGRQKDFYDGSDALFVEHKTKLMKSVDELRKSVSVSTYGHATYLKVTMNSAAIARSYRPVQRLLTPDLFPCVGAASVGELFFFAPFEQLSRLYDRIQNAEDTPKQMIHRQTGKEYLAVSRERSEVGAIDLIGVSEAQDKRRFDARTAVSRFEDAATLGGYIIELFKMPALEEISDRSRGQQELFESLLATIRNMGAGTQAALLPNVGQLPLIELKLYENSSPTLIEDRRSVRNEIRRDEKPSTLTLSVDPQRHELALQSLANHPLVRRISLPGKVVLSDSQPKNNTNEGDFPDIPKIDGEEYPRVGVIDTGVCETLSDWVVHRHDFLDETEVNPSHGSFVSGLLIGGRAANGPHIAPELNGCEVVDIPLFPNAPFSDVYPGGFDEFLEEMEQAIREAVKTHGTRIFNLSINLLVPVEEDQYSIYAARLDEIQDRYGVLIINSAGNLPSDETRSPWPKKTKDVLSYFALRTNPDTILAPTESVRTISVGALNPPGSSHLENCPTTYTRRGPGLRMGLKPDLSHFGGAGVNPGEHTGLVSCSTDGQACTDAGTSFAAPLVAKTIAALDKRTLERLTPRTLKAFAVHNSNIPKPLQRPQLRELGRQFVGYGTPSEVDRMVETDDFSITLLFESRLTIGEKKPAILRFPFTWPAQLVDPIGSGCRGRASITLVYDPPLDPAFGAEFVRVNLDALLRQRQPNDTKKGLPSFQSQLNQVFLPRTKNQPTHEKTLIKHGLKWWPVKRYEANFVEGRGSSSEWHLQVECDVRAEAVIPAEGIPFSVILTIEDPTKTNPVYQEMRRQLTNRSTNLSDLEVAQQIRPRT